MPRLATPLSDAQVKRAKAGAKLIKLFDGHGLYLEVQPTGAKFWRFRYRQANGKETTITFGPYPEVSLADARDKRSDARRLLLEGIDPIQKREQARRESVRAIEYTFRKVATEWLELKQKSWTPAYATNVTRRLEMDVFPDIGRLPIDEVTHRDLIDVFRKTEARGAHEIAKRNKAICRQIFSYAIQTGVATRNLLIDMNDVLQPVSANNFPAIATDELPQFLEVLRSNEACMQPITRIGLRLLMLVFEWQAAFRRDYRRMLDVVLSRKRPVAVATIYDGVPGLAPGLRTALAPFNDVILREAAERGLPVLDLRLVCADPADYAASSPIEPSAQGGRKIAEAIAELVLSHDAAARRTVVYGGRTP